MFSEASRRQFLKATGGVGIGIGVAGCLGDDGADVTTTEEETTTDDGTISVAMVIPGQIDDGGFMQAGYEGLQQSETEFGVETTYTAEVAPELDPLTTAIRELADDGPDLLIAHGGQCSDAMSAVAPDYPDIEFSVNQGEVTGENLASYVVLQEESAWLAGAAAGMLTETDVVGHLSGIRVPPGLKGRAAFADGLDHTNEDARFLTTFCGDQDDADLAKAVTEAQIDEGIDYLFTMLNAGRSGAIEACREAGIKQFGNVVEWYPKHPDVFVGSAIADSSMDVVNAVRDFVNGDWESNAVHEIGLEDPDAVRLSLAPDVPQDVVDRTEELKSDIIDGRITVATSYDGPKFNPDEVQA